mmetsp:Transcript_39218/g.107979  ORF Transcript_39218/g.107979 Transcript_39218/m.107979 type:complete len:313 (-) Transcript_39218:164-1102(-)
MPSSASAVEPAPSIWNTVFASSCSICLGKIITHPVDTIKAKLQVHVKASSTTPPLTRILELARKHPAVLYEGFSVAALGSLPAGAMYMTSYELAKARTNQALPNMPFLADFSAGFLAEAASCILWCPVDVTKERLQVQRDFSHRFYKYEGPIDAFRQIVRTEGVARGLYRAYGATLVAFGPQTAINLALYEQLEKRAKKWYGSVTPRREPNAQLPFWLNFTCASLSGCVACLATNPLDLAKLRMQVVRASQGSAAEKIFDYKNIGHALWRIGWDEGLVALFAGASMRCLVFVPQTAIFLGTFKYLLARLEAA